MTTNFWPNRKAEERANAVAYVQKIGAGGVYLMYSLLFIYYLLNGVKMYKQEINVKNVERLNGVDLHCENRPLVVIYITTI